MTRFSNGLGRQFGGRHKPGLEAYLKAVDLDVVYHRAMGDTLFCRLDDGREVEVLDLVGGYGVLLLGHHHPQLVAAATDYLASGTPNHVQGSIRPGANQLALALQSRLPGEYDLVLANSGAEAVEAALKHAMLETGGRTFIAIEGGFHGKTLGALRVTSNPQFRVPVGDAAPRVIRIAPNHVSQLEEVMTQVDNPAGFIFEPIQGEAGVRPLSADFLRAAARWCDRRNIPLIADECQTGLGRTGQWLASESMGVTPDYILLSKALGGGIAKISALLIDRRRYRPEFDLIHSSTFADDEFSCAIALRVLELVDDEAMAQCRSKGTWLVEQLRVLQCRYPDVIADVRGRGLMIGVEFNRPERNAGFVLNHLSDRNLLGPLIASFLLHEHGIRIASTLSNSRTLRIQPSLLISLDRLQRVVDAMTSVCEQLSRQDVAGLTGRLSVPAPNIGMVPAPPTSAPPVYRYHPTGSRTSDAKNRSASDPTRRVAWIFHFIDQGDLDHLDSGLRQLADEKKRAFCERWSSLAEPIVMDTIQVRSSSHQSVELYPILLPVTSEWMLRNARGRPAHATQLVQRAVDVAEAIGCGIVSLGQFTSIVTRCGKTLRRRSRETRITAGGSYTAALVDQAVRAELKQRTWDPADLVLGVVGATGDIAGTCASVLGPLFKRSVLVGSGRMGSLERLQSVARKIPGASIATDPRAVGEANVVVCATNSTTVALGPECISDDAIVCDASVPASISPYLARLLPNVTLCPGAIVQLPNREQVPIPGFPLPPGYTYGCMAEGLLMGLERSFHGRWNGRSSVQQAHKMSQIGDRHGFRVAPSGMIVESSEATP